MTGPFGSSDDEPASTRIVALTDKDLEDAGRLLRLLTEASDAVLLHPAVSSDFRGLARRELRHRRRRRRHFPESMFGEAAWDIMLFLYVEKHGRRFSIGRLTEQLRLPLSSTIRWVNFLTGKGLLRRAQHPTDQRTVFVEITDQGLQAVEAYFSETLDQSP